MFGADNETLGKIFSALLDASKGDFQDLVDIFFSDMQNKHIGEKVEGRIVVGRKDVSFNYGFHNTKKEIVRNVLHFKILKSGKFKLTFY